MTSEYCALFKGASDRYNGVTVDSQKEPCNLNLFIKQLTESLDTWQREGRRCIWFNVHINEAEWIPLLAKNGFNFHHSKDNSLLMYKWLPTDKSSNLPPAPHTNLGVGGLVFNKNNQILVVQENHSAVSHWKLPGGYIEKGEDIQDAAVREVKEETGIDAIFESLVTFRHTHNMGFGSSDIYVVVNMQATSEIINRCMEEISDCKWVDVEEYLQDPNVIDFNRFILKEAVELRKKNLKLNLVKSTVTVGKFCRQVNALVVNDSK